MLIEEVHLWRGTTAERALRTELVKSTQFAYFNEQLDHPDWRNKLVFDFGGNQGNLLRDPSCSIRPRDYYCIDVLREAIDALVHIVSAKAHFLPRREHELP